MQFQSSSNGIKFKPTHSLFGAIYYKLKILLIHGNQIAGEWLCRPMQCWLIEFDIISLELVLKKIYINCYNSYFHNYMHIFHSDVAFSWKNARCKTWNHLKNMMLFGIYGKRMFVHHIFFLFYMYEQAKNGRHATIFFLFKAKLKLGVRK